VGSRYAQGAQAWGLCKRCGLQFLLRNLVFDGYMPGLRVCIDCYEGRHPQEYPIDVTDPEGVWRSTSDDPPYGAVLGGSVNQGNISLVWQAPDSSGGARFESYTLLRAYSLDGLTFTPLLAINLFPIVYDDFGGLIQQTLAFTDNVSQVGFYQYSLTAQNSRGNGPASNFLTLDVTQLIPLRILEDGVTFRVLEDGSSLRELEQ
jgi:hypothetical protein